MPSPPLWALLEVQPAAVSDPDATIPIERAYAVWEAADAALRRDDLAIEVATSGRRGPNDVFTFVLMTSATISDALDNAVRYMGLVTTGARWSIERTAREALVVQTRTATRRGAALSVEVSLSEAVQKLRSLLQEDVPVDATFRHEAPADTKRHRAFFKGAVTFSAPRNTLRFPSSLLSQQLPKGDASLAAYFAGEANRALEKRGHSESMVERVNRCLTRDVSALPTLERVAAELALSERTLRRRLEDEGVSFQSLLDDVRVSVARQHLSQAQLSVGEVAYLLGFSEPSAFHRAFKRWTGQSPSAFRQRHESVAAGGSARKFGSAR